MNTLTKRAFGTIGRLPREAFEKYSFAVLIFSLAFLLKLWIAPLESGLPFVIFYPAMVITFYLFGIGPGTVVTALSAAGAYIAFMPWDR